jgi:general secretion pathway protein K
MSVRRKSSGERGMILLVVLWTLALMSVVAVALSAYLQRNIRVAATDRLELNTELALRSGFNAAAAALWAMKPEQRATLLGFERKLNLGGGITATAVFTEATGRADLNTAGIDLLRNLFTAATGSEAKGKNLAAAVVEARGGEEGASTQGGDNRSVADASQPATASGEREGADGPPQKGPAFQTPLQLQQLPGALPDDVNRILPFVGVLSRRGKINVFAAPLPVLQAVPGLSRTDRDIILKARAGGDAKGEALNAVLQKFPDLLTVEASRAFIVDVKLDPGPEIIANRSAFATILLTPDGAKPFQLLALSW